MTLRIRSRLRTGAAAARGMFLVATRGRPTADGPYKVFVVGCGRSRRMVLDRALAALPPELVDQPLPLPPPPLGDLAGGGDGRASFRLQCPSVHPLHRPKRNHVGGGRSPVQTPIET